MKTQTRKEIAALADLATMQLCQRYGELYGHQPCTHQRGYLIRKIAWRIQALAEGDISERARQRAAELANDADVRTMPPKAVPTPVAKKPSRDSRLPALGTILTRNYKGRALRVTIKEDGFEFEGERFKTLTAVAKRVTGTHCNGYRFFDLGGNHEPNQN